MALQVWLPLNGDLKNKGCTDVTVVNNGATVDNNGKIGKCYYFNGNGYITLPSFNTTKSICFWLKSPKTNNTIAFVDYKSKLGFGFYANRIVVTSSGYSAPCYDTDNFIANNWNHIAIINTNNDVLLYINGILQTSRSGSDNWSNSVDGCYIGKRSTGYPITGYINDFRIYDHCLSPAEVKAISRGLILHYKLDDPYIGLKFYEYLEKSSTAGTKDYIDTGINNYSVESIRCVCEASINDTGDSAFFGTRGNYYVFYKLSDNYFWPQSKATTMNNTTLSIDTRYIIDYNKGHFTVTDKNGLLYQEATRTGTTLNTSNLYIFNFNPTDSRTAQAKIYYFKIYNNDVLLRDFVPCSYNGEPGFWDKVECKFYGNKGSGTFTLGTEVSLTTIVTDSSGYGNHGTITGTFNVNSNAPRYNFDTQFPDSACSIGIGNLATLLPEKVLTFSTWFKKVTGEWSSKSWETLLGGPYGFEFEAKRSSSPYLVAYSWGQSSSGGQTYELDKWNMATMTRTSSETKFYLNGELFYTGTAGSVPSGDYFVGAWKTALQQNYRGYLSDVRIYATALSAEDIRQLYEVSAKVDNKGNIECFEIEESNTNPEITKTGTVKAKNCIETFDYLYLPAGTYVSTDVAYAYNETCTADTVMRYASGGSGRDLMGYSPSGGGYWGVTANGAWEPHGTFSYTDSDITKVNRIHYSFSSERDAGTYRIGILSGSYSVRDKYIYRVTLYHEGTMVRDMYPAKHGDTFGLVDIITNSFYPSVGSNVTVGNDNSEYRAKIRNNYIEVNEFIEI